MNRASPTFPAWSTRRIETLLRSDGATLKDWITQQPAATGWLCVALVVAGAGMYGSAMGSWRDAWQGLYTGIKLPIVILLTTAGNGLLNGMLAPLLGLNITFRQSLVLVLVGFALACVVLAGLTPVAWFVVWNTPPLNAHTSLSTPEYGFLQLTLALFIGLAGVIGNIHLLPLLQKWANERNVALRVLFAWLAVNLLLGSQIAWVLRPFIWDPSGPVEFIGKQYFHGSFYETLFEAARRLILMP